MSNEIERKFLVKEFNCPVKEIMDTAVKKYFIEQDYLICEEDSEARVRHRRDEITEEDEYFVTVKVGKGLVRKETEVKICKDIYEKLKKESLGGVRKMRFVTPEGYEVDIFEGKLFGLVLVEKEFSSEEEANAFQPPVWFWEEVTNSKIYKNKNLALRGLPPEPKV